MKDITKFLRTNGLTSQSNHIFRAKKIQRSKKTMGSVSDRRAQLEAVKDTAELWLQADLDNLTARKIKLETDLEKALSNLEQSNVSPITKIFVKICVNSEYMSP